MYSQQYAVTGEGGMPIKCEVPPIDQFQAEGQGESAEAKMEWQNWSPVLASQGSMQELFNGEGGDLEQSIREGREVDRKRVLASLDLPPSPALPMPTSMCLPCRVEAVTSQGQVIFYPTVYVDAHVVKTEPVSDDCSTPSQPLPPCPELDPTESTDLDSMADWEVDRQEWHHNRRRMYNLIMTNVFSCSHCGKEYRSSEQLKIHLQNVHTQPEGEEKAMSAENTSSCPSQADAGSARCDSAFKTKDAGGETTGTSSGEEVDLSAWIIKSRRKYTCKECSRRFVYQGCARRHVLLTHYQSKDARTSRGGGNSSEEVLPKRVHSKEKHSLDCTVCGSTFALAQHLQKHMERNHTGHMTHSCPKCKESFAQVSHLQQHIIQVHKKLRSSRKMCGTVFASKTEMRRRNLSSPKRCAKKTCQVCGKICSRSIDLKVHMDTQHADIQDESAAQSSNVFPGAVQPLPSGGEKLPTQGAPSETQPRAGNSQEQQRSCPHCDKSFSGETTWKLHIKLVHGNSSSNSCQGKQGKPKKAHGSSLIGRLLSRRRVQTVPRCPYCEKTFTSYNSLRGHLAVHKIAKHKCSKCGDAFPRLPLLKRHMKRAHQEKLHAFVCKQCGKSYSRKYHLKEHIDGIHKGICNVCNICGRKFSRRVHLKKHLKSIHKIDTSEQPKTSHC